MGCVSSTPKPQKTMPFSVTPIKALAPIDYPRQQWTMQTRDPLEVNPAKYLPAMPPKVQVEREPPRLQSITRPTPTTIDTEPKDLIVISEDHLEEYIKLEGSIHDLEGQRVLQRLHVAVDQMQCAAMEAAVLEETKQKIDTELKSRKLGKGPNLETTGRQLIDEIDAIDKTLNPLGQPNSKVKSNGVTTQIADSLEKKKEIIDEKLQEKRSLYQKCESEVCKLNIQAAELLDMYLMQDELIVKIFGHGYSTDEEAKLGKSLECLEEKKARIEHARRKWKEAQLLLEYACKQLAVAVQQWQDLPSIPSINLEVRYVMSDEVSKSLKSAGENLKFVGGGGGGGRGNAGSEQLPSCTPDELAALEAMAANTQPDELDDHSDTHKRAVAMLKWFNRVLNTAIHRDLVDVSEEVRVTSQALRKERIGIISDRMNEKYGRSVYFADEFKGDAALVKKMLSSCKDGHDCQLIFDADQKIKSVADGNPKLSDIGEDVKEARVHVLTDLKSEHERDMAKLMLSERENRAKVQKNVDQQLNARREIRVGRSPNRSAM